MPRPTVRDLLERKRSEIRANRADFRSLLKSAPTPVRAAYTCCRRRLNYVLRRSVSGIDMPIYDTAKDASLTKAQAARVVSLLNHPANGWRVQLDSQRSRSIITFTFDPSAD